MIKPLSSLKCLSAVSLLSATIAFTPVQKVNATGFPVVDIASIVQAVTDYSNQLMQYAEQISQGTLQADELLTAIEQMEQMYTEYDLMVENLADLQDAVDAGDYMEAFGIVTDSNLRQFVNSDILDLSEEALDVYVAVDDARRSRFGGASKTAEEILEEIKDLYPDSPEVVETAQVAFNQQQAHSAKASIDKVFESILDEYEDNILTQEATVNSLGANSEVASLHLIAQILISQNKFKEAEMRHMTARNQSEVSLAEMLAMKRTKEIEETNARMALAMDEELIYED